MARDGVFPKAFGRVHHSWKTPWFGTVITAIFSTLVIVLTVTVDSINNVFNNLILDIGVLVALYYGVTGLASFWAFRKVLSSSVRLLILAGILPLIGGIFLFAIAGYVVYQSWIADVGATLPVLIAVGAGVPLMVAAVATNHSGFFRAKTVSYVMVNGKLTASTSGSPS